MMEPDPQLLKELRRRCKEATGHEFADVRWHPMENCLAIFERHRAEPPNAPGVVRTFLLDDAGNPRQLERHDVEEVITSIYGRQKAIDSWNERWAKVQEKRKEEGAARRHLIARDTAKELVRVFKRGIQPYFLFGGADESSSPSVAQHRLSSGEPFTITDLRRVKE